MEVKKVQEVKGSYYVYLPKSWCKKYIIGNSSKEVQLKCNEDDSLLIFPQFRQISAILQLTLELVKTADEESCLNSLLAAYIVGVDRVELITKDKFSLEFRDKVAQLLNHLIGFEITNETENTILVQEVSITLELDGMLRRILSKVGLILNDVADILNSLNMKDAKLIVSQDDDVDKFRYSIERQVHQILRQPHLARKLKINPIECLHLSQCTKFLERIADHCVTIALLIIEGKKPSPTLLEIYKMIRELYIKMQTNFFPDDVDANYEILSQTHHIIKNLDQLGFETSEDKLFALNLRRISSYCSDIAEVRINSFIYKESLTNVLES